MKLLKLITVSLFSITVLCSCDFEERVSWSPDGKRMAVLADRLRLADNNDLSKPLLEPHFGQLLSLRWLPDNHHVLICYRRTKCALASSSSMASARKSDGKVGKAISVFTDYVQMFDFNGAVKDAKVTAGAVLYKSALPIVDLRLSPDGKLASIAQADNGRHKISIVTLSGAVRVVAKNASKSDWSRDSRSIYFFRDVSPKDSGYVTAIPIATICRLPVADVNGKLLAKSARHDLGQCAGELTGGGRLRVLSDESIMFCTTPVKLPSVGLDFGLAEKTLFRFKPASKDKDTKATIEQVNIEGPALANALDSFEPNADGTYIAVLGNRGAVNVILPTGKVTLLEKAIPDSADASLTGSFGFAPCWRNNHELCFTTRNIDKSKGHDGDIVLQDLSNETGDMTPRQILSKNWPVGQIDFLKIAKAKSK